MNNHKEYNDFDKALRSKIEGYSFDFEHEAQQKFVEIYGEEAILPDESFLTSVRKSLPLLVLLMMLIIGLSLWVKDAVDNRRLHTNPKVERIPLMANTPVQNNIDKNKTISPLAKKIQEDNKASQVQNDAHVLALNTNIEPKNKSRQTGLSRGISSKPHSQAERTSQSIPLSSPSLSKGSIVSVNHNDQVFMDQDSKPSRDEKHSFVGFDSSAASRNSFVGSRTIKEASFTPDLLDPLSNLAFQALEYASIPETLEDEMKFDSYDKRAPKFKRFSVGVSGNYFRTNTTILANQARVTSNDIASNKGAFISQENNSSSVGYNVGIVAFLNLNNRFRLRTGALYNESNYMHARSRITYPDSSVGLADGNSITTEIATKKQQSINIPLGMDVMFRPKRLNIACYLGSLVSYNTILSNIQVADINGESFQQLVDYDESSAETNSSSSLAWQVLAGLEVPIGQKMKMSVEPNLGFNTKTFLIPSSGATAKTLMEPGIALRLSF